MANKWLAHVKKTMKSHKGMKFGQVLKMAKKTYRGGGDGGVQPFSDFGGDSDISVAGANSASPNAPIRDAAPLGGRRRRSRRSRKTRRGGQY